jgi:hypothetical protein
MISLFNSCSINGRILYYNNFLEILCQSSMCHVTVSWILDNHHMVNIMHIKDGKWIKQKNWNRRKYDYKVEQIHF